MQQRAGTSNAATVFVDRLNLERVQVVKYDQIGHEAGSDRATIKKTEILCGIVGCQTKRFDGIEAKRDSPTHHRIDVTTGSQILRITIVSDKEGSRGMQFFN